MVSFDLSVTTTNIGAGYDDIQRMLNGVTCSSGGMGLLTPSACSPMSSFCSSNQPYSARDLKNRIHQFCQHSGPITGFYSLYNEKIMFEEALLVPTVLEAVESTFWISALSRLGGERPSTFDTVILSFFVGLISLVCGAMFVGIVSSAVKIYRLMQTMRQARTLNENVQRLLAPQATNMRSAFAKLKGIVASKALDQVEQGYRKFRNRMITSFVANALITIAFCALLASVILSAFFIGGASGCLMAAFFGCLGVGLGSLTIGMLVGIVSAICQRKHKQEAARCIQRGIFYSLILEQMQRFPKDFFRDPVAKSIMAIQQEKLWMKENCLGKKCQALQLA
ncbi:inclusion membrane protein GarD [Chlamydia muridarum]|uniref:inclusion membrane protein GarD n=1 Tax=Chlamydia muridarum TaxID=83560 RepID=UPI0002F663BF|nr:hypothetical protein [Chlamydia muridarum]KDU80906.1 hypothetical protein DU17_0449 [Chlamydia muridarum]KDU83365.1 hypothetical protein DU20_0447 [Chlamydia muridarum]KDU84002.1 hypothetical protein DU21_0449 [Chlamydia muridarum]